jgi:hypothetical protein
MRNGLSDGLKTDMGNKVYIFGLDWAWRIVGHAYRIGLRGLGLEGNHLTA